MFYPALSIDAADGDLIQTIVDDYSPTALDEFGSTMRVFFSTPAARDGAGAALAAAGIIAERIDVDDEDWARRSQQNLPPITVGRITVTSAQCSVPSAQFSAPSSEPPAASPQPPAPSREPPAASPQPRAVSPQPPIVIAIPPSMGFGTGHHATTRLCLAALQTLDLSGAFMLDVGTGSGVLAIAASLLGAARAMGIDNDADAVQAARESLALNPGADGVELDVIDLMASPLPQADVVTANLTGALLARAAGRLAGSVRPGGTLIVSGLLAEERDIVRAAFAASTLVSETKEDGWTCLCLQPSK